MSASLRIAILAGEASGDILGAGLMRGLLELEPGISFIGIGGPQMQACGLDSLFPMERLSVMGLVEPLKRLPELLGIRHSFFEALKNDPPDVFVGIDSPDFNLGLEKKCRQIGIPTVHYVSPSVWAWRQGRIKKIKQAVDLMLALFPFEEEFYKKHDVPVIFTGHPLADDFALETDTLAARNELSLQTSDPVLAVLPGSRGGEVKRLGTVFLETARRCKEKWPNLQIIIPCANDERKAQLSQLLDQQFSDLDIILVDGNSRTVMASADYLLMASGTATLEGMLLKKPMVVAYKMAPFSFAIISRMLKAPFVALPNLLANKAIIPEYLQNDATPENLFAAIEDIIDSKSRNHEITETWKSIHLSLRRNANLTAAKAVLGLCKK